MPTYEYGCKLCGYRFEEFQNIADEPMVTCPSCGKESLERLVSGGAGLIFKGSGFYITDYKKQNNQSAAAGGNGADSTQSKKKESSSSTSKDKTKDTSE